MRCTKIIDTNRYGLCVSNQRTGTCKYQFNSKKVSDFEQNFTQICRKQDGKWITADPSLPWPEYSTLLDIRHVAAKKAIYFNQSSISLIE